MLERQWSWYHNNDDDNTDDICDSDDKDNNNEDGVCTVVVGIVTIWNNLYLSITLFRQEKYQYNLLHQYVPETAVLKFGYEGPTRLYCHRYNN